MAKYFCNFKLPENTKLTKEQAHTHIVNFWEDLGMIRLYFDENLDSTGEIDEDMTFGAQLLDLSLQLPDVLIWVDSHFTGEDSYRTYALNGKLQIADSVLTFNEPKDSWV